MAIMAHVEDAGLPVRPSRHRPDMALPGDRVHRAAIREFADELGRPYAEVSALYRDVYAALEAKASISHFLPVFVFRRIREHYRSTSL